MRRIWAVGAVAVAAAILAGCAGGAPLEATLGPSGPPERRPMLTPGAPGALPPPRAAFEAATSAAPDRRVEARALLAEARRAAGLEAGEERISLLDLPPGVVFAAPGPQISVATPPFAGADPAYAAAARAGFLDALGGGVSRELAYLAPLRLAVRGEARGDAAGGAMLSLALFDLSGAALEAIEARLSPRDAARAGRAAPSALGRRAAERLLASPSVAAALTEEAHGGFARPGPAAREAGAALAASPLSVAILGVRGAPGGGGDALAAAIGAALPEAGFALRPASAARFAVSAEVAITRGAAGDRAMIRWLFTERRPGRPEALLGEITQERAGARGAFDGAWGPLAIAAARAAASALRALAAEDAPDQARAAPPPA